MAPLVLMVAEKPSLAQSLAKILSNGSCTSWKGSNGACSIHEWSGKFHSDFVTFRMTSVCGHVMTCDFPPKYNNWDKVDPVSVFHHFNIITYILCFPYCINIGLSMIWRRIHVVIVLVLLHTFCDCLGGSFFVRSNCQCYLFGTSFTVS